MLSSFKTDKGRWVNIKNGPSGNKSLKACSWCSAALSCSHSRTCLLFHCLPRDQRTRSATPLIACPSGLPSFFFFPFCFHQAPSCTHFDDIIWAVGLVRARPRRLAGVTHGRTPISQSGCFFLPGLVSPTVLLFTGTDYSWWLHLNHIRFISFICCLPYHAQGG